MSEQGDCVDERVADRWDRIERKRCEWINGGTRLPPVNLGKTLAPAMNDSEGLEVGQRSNLKDQHWVENRLGRGKERCNETGMNDVIIFQIKVNNIILFDIVV